jgi:hypothetical protein
MSKTSPPASLETQSSQRKNVFSFLLRGQKRKRSTLWRCAKNMAGQIKAIIRKEYYVAVKLVFFVFLPLKAKEKKVNSAFSVPLR